jgi:hypothetical protein
MTEKCLAHHSITWADPMPNVPPSCCDITRKTIDEASDVPERLGTSDAPNPGNLLIQKQYMPLQSKFNGWKCSKMSSWSGNATPSPSLYSGEILRAEANLGTF